MHSLYFFSVLNHVFLTAKGKSIIKKHIHNFNARAAYSEMVHHMTASTKANHKKQELMKFVVSSKFGKNNTKTTATDFIYPDYDHDAFVDTHESTPDVDIDMNFPELYTINKTFQKPIITLDVHEHFTDNPGIVIKHDDTEEPLLHYLMGTTDTEQTKFLDTHTQNPFTLQHIDVSDSYFHFYYKPTPIHEHNYPKFHPFSLIPTFSFHPTQIHHPSHVYYGIDTDDPGGHYHVHSPSYFLSKRVIPDKGEESQDKTILILKDQHDNDDLSLITRLPIIDPKMTTPDNNGARLKAILTRKIIDDPEIEDPNYENVRFLVRINYAQANKIVEYN